MAITRQEAFRRVMSGEDPHALNPYERNFLLDRLPTPLADIVQHAPKDRPPTRRSRTAGNHTAYISTTLSDKLTQLDLPQSVFGTSQFQKPLWGIPQMVVVNQLLDSYSVVIGRGLSYDTAIIYMDSNGKNIRIRSTENTPIKTELARPVLEAVRQDLAEAREDWANALRSDRRNFFDSFRAKDSRIPQALAHQVEDLQSSLNRSHSEGKLNKALVFGSIDLRSNQPRLHVVSDGAFHVKDGLAPTDLDIQGSEMLADNFLEQHFREFLWGTRTADVLQTGLTNPPVLLEATGLRTTTYPFLKYEGPAYGIAA